MLCSFKLTVINKNDEIYYKLNQMMRREVFKADFISFLQRYHATTEHEMKTKIVHRYLSQNSIIKAKN
jgi:hypothetical protein